MGIEPRVVAAISSAIGSYLQAEQEALPEQLLAQSAQPPPVMCRSFMSSPFALAGRMAAMDIRWTWQMRLAR